MESLEEVYFTFSLTGYHICEYQKKVYASIMTILIYSKRRWPLKEYATSMLMK